MSAATSTCHNWFHLDECDIYTTDISCAGAERDPQAYPSAILAAGLGIPENMASVLVPVRPN